MKAICYVLINPRGAHVRTEMVPLPDSTDIQEPNAELLNRTAPGSERCAGWGLSGYQLCNWHVVETKTMIDDRPMVPCEICGQPTPMSTKRCDRCWELERRIRHDPYLTGKIIARMRLADCAFDMQIDKGLHAD